MKELISILLTCSGVTSSEVGKTLLSVVGHLRVESGGEVVTHVFIGTGIHSRKEGRTRIVWIWEIEEIEGKVYNNYWNFYDFFVISSKIAFFNIQNSRKFLKNSHFARKIRAKSDSQLHISAFLMRLYGREQSSHPRLVLFVSQLPEVQSSDKVTCKSSRTKSTAPGGFKPFSSPMSQKLRKSSLYSYPKEVPMSIGIPGTANSRRPLPMKKALINWVTDREKTMLTSVVASHDTLSDFLDKELSSGRVETEALKGSESRMTEGMQTRSEEKIRKVRKREVKDSFKRPVPTPRLLPIDVLPFKSALRDRDWVSKARFHLYSTFSQLLRLSNGVSLSSPESPCLYTYYLGKGNNHHLVQNCFKTRGFWVKSEEDSDQESVNIVWTQGKIKYLYRCYPESDPKEIATPQYGQCKLPCPVLLTQKEHSGVMKNKQVDTSCLHFELITESKSYTQVPVSVSFNPEKLCTHNKLEHNYHLTNKKTLFMSMKRYCEVTGENLGEIVPVTYHITNGLADVEFARFLDDHTTCTDTERRLLGLWIVKPGENTNRGSGITLCHSLDQVKISVSAHSFCPISGLKRTFILQKYIENPMLISKRKFDIRCYVLVTSVNSVIQGYFYQEGYLRTSSKEFSLKDTGNRYIHLTNDAVQKHCEDYGRYETGNKLSYKDFQRHLDSQFNGKTVQLDVLPQIRMIVKKTLLASFAKVNADNCEFSFEILGYDFMMDGNGKVWLIEVNTNPCLEMSSPLLARVIPAMLDNAFRIAVDPYFPDHSFTGSSSTRRLPVSLTGELIPENRFELLFHSQIEGQHLRSQLGNRFHLLEEFDRSLQDMPDESYYESSSEEW